MPFACSAGCHFWYKYADIHSDNYFLVSRCPFSLRQKRPALQEISIWKPHGHCDCHKINITIQFTYLCFTMRPTPLHYVKAWSKTPEMTHLLSSLWHDWWKQYWKYLNCFMFSTTDVFGKVQKRSHWKDIWSKTRISLGEIFWRWMIWVSGRLNLIQQQILAISSKSDRGIIQHSFPDVNPSSKADKPTGLNWIYYAL